MRTFFPSLSVQTKGVSALFLAAFIFATFGVYARFMALMFGDNAQVAARLVAVFGLLLLINAFHRAKEKLSFEGAKKAGFLGVSFTIGILFFTYSINQIKLADTVFLVYASSLATSILLGSVFFQERLSVMKISVIVLCLSGLLVYAGGATALSMGAIAGLMCGFFESISHALRKSLKSFPKNAVLQFQHGVGALCASGILLFSQETIFRGFNTTSLIALALFVASFVVMGKLLLFGFGAIDLSYGGVIVSTEIIFAMILGYLFFSEMLASHELAGSALVLVASLMSALASRTNTVAENPVATV